MNQSGVKAYLDAKNIALFGFFLLILGAMLDLNTLPFKQFLSAAIPLFHGHLFDVFKSYSGIFFILFFFTRPAKKYVLFVIVTGVISSVLVSIFWAETAFVQWQTSSVSENFSSFIAFTSIPALLTLLLRITSRIKTTESVNYERNLRQLFVLILLLIAIPPCALELETSFHPVVMDFFAMRWDAAAHLNITSWIFHTVNLIPGLSQLVQLAYSYTHLGFLCVAISQLNGFPKQTASGAKTWVIISACALLAYNFFPITGPRYIFGSEHYVDLLNSLTNYPHSTVAGSTAPRNGMPSMHFGWMLASTILWWRTGSAWWTRFLFILATTLTAIATIYLGEHYVVDLIVAVPFTLAAIALCTHTVSWSHIERKWTVITGFLTWFVWVIVLREFVPFAEQHPWFCWLMNGSTAIVVIFQSIAINRFKHLAELRLSDESTNMPTTSTFFGTLKSKVSAMFFASGAAALIYQVLFAKTLALAFGSTSTATLTVLGTFLGGMAIGSFFGGKFASQTKRPLFAYSIIEGLIAIYCIATPTLFHLTQTIYVSLATGIAPEAPFLLLLRVCLGGLVLIIPTVLMGATLPLLAQVLQVETQRIGAKIALLYLVNTAGATFGALLCGYLLIPAFGIINTTLFAALLNFLVALGGLDLNKKISSSPVLNKIFDEKSITWPTGVVARLVLTSLCVGGILSLGLEVVYVHMLSIIAGNSVYAFSLMLATFLAGLSIGGFIIKNQLERKEAESLTWLAYCFMGLALSTAGSIYFWNTMPAYFASFAGFSPVHSFTAREAIRGMVCALIMLPPTMFIGAAYVLGMDIITHLAPDGQIRVLGLATALNTVGNIVGVLLFGFFLLPLMGGLRSIHLIGFISLLLSVLILSFSKLVTKKQPGLLLGASAIVIVLSIQMPLNYQALSSGSNVYFAPQVIGNVIDHAESIDGGLTSVTQASDSGTTTLLTNGKFQGNNAWDGEMKAQIGFAFVPLMHQEQRRRALVIGYGTGATSRVFHDAGFKELDIAELSNDVVTMANKHFSDVNQGVSNLPHVHLHVTDGRNLLLLAPRELQYDVVSLEISSIWFAGAASLYNQEFYQLVKAHLQPGGILQQWVQLHHLDPTDILSIISTVRSEFTFVSLYKIGGQGILIASNDPRHKEANATALYRMQQSLPLTNLLRRARLSMDQIKESRELTSEDIDHYLAKVGIDPVLWISNDNNVRLEYSTPKRNGNNSITSFTKNMEILRQFRAEPVQLTKPVAKP